MVFASPSAIILLSRTTQTSFSSIRNGIHNSLDLPRLFRQHDRDAVADRISELCRARDQLLGSRIEFKRTLGDRTDQDFQQFGIDGVFGAFRIHGAVSGSIFSIT